MRELVQAIDAHIDLEVSRRDFMGLRRDGCGLLGDGSARGLPLRDLGQIPYSAPLPPSQTQADAANEEETASLRELVQAIEAHVDLEVSRRDFMGSGKDGWRPSR